MLDVFSFIPAPQWSKTEKLKYFLSRSWKIFIFNCKYFSLKLVFRWQAIWRAWCQVFLAWMILRPDSRDDNTLNVKPHMWPFVLNFSRSKYFQTSLNIFNLFQSSLFDKYFLLPSRYQYSPGANFYIKFSLTAEAIYRWHNVGIIELLNKLNNTSKAGLGNYYETEEKRRDRLGRRESISIL